MLKADKERMECGIRIREKIIPDTARANKYVASYVPKGGPMKPCRAMAVKGVTIHNTQDLVGVEDDAEQYTRATWPNCNMGGVAVHYYVDEWGAWQNLREDEQGWHAADGAGPGNTTTVAIEIIMDGSGSEADTKAADNGARLAASILRRHGLTTEQLYTHNHWMGQPDKIVANVRKNCPIYLLPQWETFKAKVNGYIAQLDGKPVQEPQKPQGGVKDKLYRVQVGAYHERENARRMLGTLQDKGITGFIVEAE